MLTDEVTFIYIESKINFLLLSMYITSKIVSISFSLA